MNFLQNMAYRWIQFLGDATNGTASDIRINSALTNAETAFLSTSTGAEDDATANNRFKLIADFEAGPVRHARIYVGRYTGTVQAGLVITSNVVWDAPTQLWSLDVSGQDGTAIAIKNNGVDFLFKASGASAWAYNAWASTTTIAGGDIFVDDDVSIGGDLDVTGPTTVGALTANSATVANNVVAGGFVYGTLQTVTRQLPLADAQLDDGGARYNPSGDECSYSTATGTVSIPFRLPTGATVTAVSCVVAQTTSGDVKCTLWEKTVSGTSIATANHGSTNQTSATGGSSNSVIAMSFTPYVVATTTTTYWLAVTLPTSGSILRSVSLSYTTFKPHGQ
jgi:hypothetical protein